jgi:hypothetical protein
MSYKEARKLLTQSSFMANSRSSFGANYGPFTAIPGVCFLSSWFRFLERFKFWFL